MGGAVKTRVKQRGFTIVELLIVIVIIAILAAITIVAFNGIQQRGRNSQMVTVARAYASGLKLYQTHNGSYPTSFPQFGICLGTGYPSGRCWTSTAGNGTYDTLSAFDSEIREYVKNPPNVPYRTYQLLGGSETRSGIVYFRNSPTGNQSLEYALEGANQSCGLGGATATNLANNTVTRCIFVLN